MEKNHQPDDKENALPAKESPKCCDEEKSGEAEKTEVDTKKSEEMETGETENKEIEKADEKEKDEGGELREPSPPPPPEIEYTLETASDDLERFLSTMSTPKEEEVEAGVEINIPEYIDKYLDLVEEKICKQELPETRVKDDGLFLKAVEQISKLYKNLCALFKLDSSQGPLINRIGRIQQRVMLYLEDEFRSLLEDQSKTAEPDQQKQEEVAEGEDQQQADQSDEESNNFPGYSQEVLANLNKIAMRMISGGYELECCEVYMITRRSAIEEALNKLGFDKISIDEAQKMQWEALEREIPTWITTFKQYANVYFSGERKLAETIFSDYPSLSDSLFSNLTRGLFMQLLNFAEAVAITKRSTEKLFKFLDIYETLRDNISAVDGVFPEDCANELRTETTTTRSRIGDTAICIFCDLENSIKSDTARTAVPGGAVHPLTRYTMNYLKYACDEYKDTLEQVFKEHSKIERADSTSRPRNYEGGDSQNYNNDQENQSPFSAQLMRIMELLDSILEAKSKLYRDVALSSIFMMNNGRYMLQKIKGSAEIHKVMGDTWRRKRSTDLRNYHQSYKRETWMKLLGCLKVEGLSVNGKVVKPELKERFKSFNAMFDEIHKTQSSWVVSDKQLQSELRVSISAIVIPAYRSFLGRFSGYLDPGRQTEKYIKFQPEDIETYIDELFDGNPSMGKRKT
ncbi:hypothetical protein PTKIN_Ptkin08bG0006300 [Pterospermum kingtungense]